MKLDGRRESSNVEDRRGMSTGTKVGVGGIGGIIIAGLLTLLMGGNIGDVLQQAGGTILNGGGYQTETGQREFTQEEQELATFASQIEASTEDVWTKIFRENNLGEYKYPTLVLYTDYVSTACGQGSAAVGPFYCSGDQKLYLDLSFFTTMQQQLGIKGNDFAYAYVVAHEVGHHVETLLGIIDVAHQKMASYGQSSARANAVSVQLELLADFFAGVWGHYENQQYNSLEVGDYEAAIDCATKIGDDYLQKRGQGYANPESFTHGTSEQRKAAFKQGFESGNINYASTYIQKIKSL